MDTNRDDQPSVPVSGTPAAEPGAISTTARPLQGSEAKQRWPVAPFLTAGFFPATTAKRMERVSLGRAYLVHVIALLLVFPLAVLLTAYAEAESPLSVSSVLDEFFSVIEHIVRPFDQNPKTYIPVLLGVILLIEVGMIALALLVTPWGAQDEPVRASFLSAIRRVWLHTAHVTLAVLLTGLLTALPGRVVRESQARLYQAYPSWPEPPDVSPAQQATSPEWQAYQNAQLQYSEECERVYAEWIREQPWYVAHFKIVIFNAGFASGIWLLWALLRAVGTPRDSLPIARPPMCEKCGYNLTTIPLESRCPECGEPVVTSLGPDARTGTIWQRRRVVGRLVAWAQCSLDALIRPGGFGQQLLVQSPGVHHRRFLVMHLPVIFFVGAVSILFFFVLDTGRNPFVDEPEVGFIAGPVFGWICVAGTIAMTLFTALAVGLVESLRGKRNLMPASIQAASYLTGYLALWAIFGAVTGLGVMVLDRAEWFQWLEDLTGVYRDLLATMAWLVPNAACLVGYIVLVARATEATRFANR